MTHKHQSTVLKNLLENYQATFVPFNRIELVTLLLRAYLPAYKKAEIYQLLS